MLPGGAQWYQAVNPPSFRACVFDCPSVRFIHVFSAEEICVKCYIPNFHENLSRNSKFFQNRIKISGSLQEGLLVEGDRSGTVVKVLGYRSEGRGFDSRWCHWNFSLT